MDERSKQLMIDVEVLLAWNQGCKWQSCLVTSSLDVFFCKGPSQGPDGGFM